MTKQWKKNMNLIYVFIVSFCILKKCQKFLKEKLWHRYSSNQIKDKNDMFSFKDKY